VLDPFTGQGIQSNINFYAYGNPEPGPYRSITTDINGNYSLTTLVGAYYLEINPLISPYPYTEIDSVFLPAAGLNYNIELGPADVMLVDDDAGQDYEHYFIESLRSAGWNYHHWDVSLSGSPSVIDMAEYPLKYVIWFTGDGSDSTLTGFEQGQILNHIANGGKLFITGQNIAEQLAGTAFLTSMGFDFSMNSSILVVFGVAGDIGDGLLFSTSGGTGASNQTSRDQLAIQDSVKTRSIFTYGTTASATAGVAVETDSSKIIFFGYGFEAIAIESARETIMQAILNYFGTATSINDGDFAINIPDEFELDQNYPNPFNPQTTIRFAVPRSSWLTIEIYNSLGQKVRLLTEATFKAGYHEIVWNGLDDAGNRLSSGVYFYRLSTKGGFNQVKKLLLMK
jgi:hypothetical protein